jgi:microcystin-dependent protein
MADNFLAEIRIFPFNFAPAGWAQCNGQLLAISQNTALFSLVGTNYGGNGTSNFGLPNMQGAATLNMGNGAGLTPRVVGETGGEPSVTLIQSEMPTHTHAPLGKAASTSADPNNSTWGELGGHKPAPNFYSSSIGNVLLHPQALGVTGGSQPHNNLMPYLALNYCIAMTGIYPARS